MKATSFYLAAFGLAGASLCSCSRATYSFNPATPAYLGAAPVPAATLPAPAPAAPAPRPLSLPPVRPAAPATPARGAAAYTAPAPAEATAPAARPGLVQRLAAHQVRRQLAKATSPNTASRAHTQRRGGGFTVAIIGLAALVVGLIVSSGLLVTIGAIVLVVGIILAILSIF